MEKINDAYDNQKRIRLAILISDKIDIETNRDKEGCSIMTKGLIVLGDIIINVCVSNNRASKCME